MKDMIKPIAATALGTLVALGIVELIRRYQAKQKADKLAAAAGGAVAGAAAAEALQDVR